MARHRLPINKDKFNSFKDYMMGWFHQFIFRDNGEDYDDNFLIELCKQIELNNYCLNSDQVKELLEIRFDIYTDYVVDDVGKEYFHCYGGTLIESYYTFNGRKFKLDEPLPFKNNYRFVLIMHDVDNIDMTNLVTSVN